MADEAAEGGAGGLGELTGRGLLFLGLVEADLHELVIEQRLIDGAKHALGDSAIAHVHQGLERVSETPQVLALKSVKLGCRHQRRGRPRMRSAVMFFWISVVPPAIVIARSERKRDDQLSSPSRTSSRPS